MVINISEKDYKKWKEKVSNNPEEIKCNYIRLVEEFDSIHTRKGTTIVFYINELSVFTRYNIRLEPNCDRLIEIYDELKSINESLYGGEGNEKFNAKTGIKPNRELLKEIYLKIKELDLENIEISSD